MRGGVAADSVRTIVKIETCLYGSPLQIWVAIDGSLIGMSAGRVVFDGAPEQLTDQVARELYGLDASEVMDAEHSIDGSDVPAANPVAA